VVIQKIRDHLKAETTAHTLLPESRARPACSADIHDRLFDSRRCAMMPRRGYKLSNKQNREGECDSALGFSLIAARFRPVSMW
jgi:hypothetical protein